MNNAPLVTVVTPSYNQGQFLEETVKSVLGQDYPNIEYMVIDGGSHDNSLAIIKKYSSRFSYWLSEKDSGQSEAINKGWKCARGKYICWLNSDDVLLPSSIRIAVENLEENPEIQAVYGNFIRIDASSRFLETVYRRQINWPKDLGNVWDPITQPGALIRKFVLEKIGYLDQSLYFCIDFDFFIRIALMFGEDSVHYIPYTLSKFRSHSNSKSSTADLIRLHEIEKLYKVLFSSKQIPESWMLVKRSAFGNLYRMLSIATNRRLEAYKSLLLAWYFQFPKPDRDLLKVTSQLLYVYTFYKDWFARE